MEKMTNEEFRIALRRAIKRVDLLRRPNAIYCNPKHFEVINKEFGEDFKVIASDAVEPDKCYLVDRKQIEPFGGELL